MAGRLAARPYSSPGPQLQIFLILNALATGLPSDRRKNYWYRVLHTFWVFFNAANDF